jgi:hypothetical protein
VSLVTIFAQHKFRRTQAQTQSVPVPETASPLYHRLIALRPKVEAAGLTAAGMRAVLPDTILLRAELVAAGVERPDDRLLIIAAIRDGTYPETDPQEEVSVQLTEVEMPAAEAGGSQQVRNSEEPGGPGCLY